MKCLQPRDSLKVLQILDQWGYLEIVCNTDWVAAFIILRACRSTNNRDNTAFLFRSKLWFQWEKPYFRHQTKKKEWLYQIKKSLFF
jgi:hypothetical protein